MKTFRNWSAKYGNILREPFVEYREYILTGVNLVSVSRLGVSWEIIILIFKFSWSQQVRSGPGPGHTTNSGWYDPLYCIALHHWVVLGPRHTTSTMSPVVPVVPVWQSDPAVTTCRPARPSPHKEFLVATLNLVINEPSWSYSAASFAKF